MSWKVLITARNMNEVGRTALEQLRAAGCNLSMPEGHGAKHERELISMLQDHDAVLAGSEAYTSNVLHSPAAARLKVISRWGVGYDSIDVVAATKNGIVVANTPGLLDDAVADYTLALLLALARHVHKGHWAMHQGNWQTSWGQDIAGKTLGILGFGRIGRAVARRAAGFSMRVLAHAPSIHLGPHSTGVNIVPLEELLTASDFLSLHAALTPQSRGLIGEAQLRRMKPTALLVNAGRGALIDESALVRALRENWIAGAALDVYTVEPLPSDDPLRACPNLLLSPHQASCGRETGERVSFAAAHAIIDLINGQCPKFVVNTQVLSSSALRSTLKT